MPEEGKPDGDEGFLRDNYIRFRSFLLRRYLRYSFHSLENYEDHTQEFRASLKRLKAPNGTASICRTLLPLDDVAQRSGVCTPNPTRRLGHLQPSPSCSDNELECL